MNNPFANAGLEQWNAPGAFEGVGKGLAAMAIDASGLGKYLDDIGISKNEKGGWQYKPVVPPSQPIAPTSQVTAPTSTSQPTVVPQQDHPEVNDSWSKTPIPITQSPVSFVNPQASKDIPVPQGNVGWAPPASLEWDQQKGQPGIGDMLKQMAVSAMFA